MRASPFNFYRGAAAVMAADFARYDSPDCASKRAATRIC